jgi:NADH-quinone oxidoreductase subunit L
MYQWKKIDADKLAGKLKPLYNFSLNKWYIDEIYQYTFIGGTLLFSKFLAWFDNTIVDGIVNGSAFVTRWISKISGVFDTYVIDGFVNFVAYLNGFFGIAFRKIQTGRVQTYVVYIVFAIIILMFIFKPF